MCNINSYGFTKNGAPSPSGSTCNAITSDIIGAEVSITTDASDVGKTILAAVGLRINDVGQGTFYSGQFTPITSSETHTFTIPFTGVSITLGTYTFGYGGAGCSYIYDITNLGSYICYSCSTTKCTTLTVTAPSTDKYYDCVNNQCTQVTNITQYKNDPTCQNKCTTPLPTHLECINITCTKVSGAGTDECVNEGSVCSSQQPQDNTILIIAGVGLAIVAGYFLLKK